MVVLCACLLSLRISASALSVIVDECSIASMGIDGQELTSCKQGDSNVPVVAGLASAECVDRVPRGPLGRRKACHYGHGATFQSPCPANASGEMRLLHRCGMLLKKFLCSFLSFIECRDVRGREWVLSGYAILCLESSHMYAGYC